LGRRRRIMGVFTDDGSSKPPVTQQEEPEVKDNEQDEPVKFDTDVPDVKADGEHQYGNIKLPVFNVSKNEFYQNMSQGRRRLRFKSGSGAQQYMSNTKYNRPFMISYTDSKGKSYQRKIK
jgi:hypothetical protein